MADSITDNCNDVVVPMSSCNTAACVVSSDPDLACGKDVVPQFPIAPSQRRERAARIILALFFTTLIVVYTLHFTNVIDITP